MNIGFLSLDISVVIILFIIFLVLSFKFGKKLLSTLIISLYPTLIIFESLPYNKLNLEDKAAQAIIFIIFYTLLIIILWKNISVKKIHSGSRKFLDYSLLSVTYILLLISIYINSVNHLSVLYRFSGSTVDLISQIPYIISLTLPILVILITNRKDKE